MTDGDVVGFKIVTKGVDPGPDDYQTSEDKEMRRALEVSMERQGKKFGKEANFKLNIDF